ncbi:hypothetical protein BDR07DRAFT_1480454 [Suillus spraguei]|nr:hypothetical protein BDR07DRAFT_1480454 [Suillus spraguei]
MAIIRRNPTMYLDELQHVFVSLQTLLRTLRRLHYSHKSISSRALERDEERRAIFMNHIAEIAPDPKMLMFDDEAAKDERTSIRRFGHIDSNDHLSQVTIWTSKVQFWGQPGHVQSAMDSVAEKKGVKEIPRQGYKKEELGKIILEAQASH